MAHVLITLKVMPSSPEADLKSIQSAVEKLIAEHSGKMHKCDVEPVAFGLKALIFQFVLDEKLGSTEPLEEKISAVPEVESVMVTGVTRLLG